MSSMKISGMSAAVLPQSQEKEPCALPEGEAEEKLQAVTRKEDGGPSLTEMLQQAREKAQEQRDRLQLPKNSARYGDTAMMAYARLSRARTQAEVSAAAGYARRQIVSLQAAKRQDSDNADRIQAAINQLQKAVSRAGKKKQELEREKLSRARQAKLEQENRLREAQRQRQELRRAQAARKIRECGYLREAEIDNRLQNHLSETRMELRAQAQALSSSVAASADAAARQYAAQAGAAVEAPSAEFSIEA